VTTGARRAAYSTTVSRVLARNSAVAAGAVGVNGLLSAALLALSAAAGQTGEIAAYTVMTSALAFVSIVAGGGSALLYVNGTDQQRVLVRSQYVLVVLPSLLVGSAVVGEFYRHRGYGASALAASAVIVLGNTLAQLQVADFSRRMRFGANAVLMCGSKAVSLALVALGVRMTIALAVVGLVQLAVGEVMLGRDGSLRSIRLRLLSARGALSAYHTNRHLFGFAVGELYVARLTTLVLSLVATPALMGSFGTVVTAYQGIGGVVQSALQVPMVARARNRLGIEIANHSTLFSVAVALVCSVPAAATVAVLAPWLTHSLLDLPHPESAGWLVLFMLALPFMALSRAFMLNQIGDGHYRWATAAMGLLAALLTVAVAIGVPWLGPLGAAGATATAEVLTLVVLVALLLRRTRRPPAGTESRPEPASAQPAARNT
jgi:O-antigen/teichoic acid export membrane protein